MLAASVRLVAFALLMLAAIAIAACSLLAAAVQKINSMSNTPLDF